MAQSKDYYAVLGVSPSADQKEIKKQYRRLAKQYHPDANKNDPKSADRFKEISEAYGVIGDEDRRKQYDDMRRLGAFGGLGDRQRPGARRPGGTGASGGFSTGPGGTGASGGFTFEELDLGGLGGLGDLFGQMFGQGARGGADGRTRAPEQGQSVEATLEVPFRTATQGGKLPFELEVTEECSNCHGSGARPGAATRTCPECKGRGTVSFGQGGFAVSRPCPACLGRGTIPSERCPTCGGSGEVRTRRKVLITVPAGAESGTRVRLKGQGGRGANGGPPGDLIITFEVAGDRDFRREGLDLLTKARINVAQATLGSRIGVRTLDDRTVNVRIPPGTPSGKRFRVRGQGVTKGDKTGDLIIETEITVPDRLSEKQEELMKQFAESAGLKH